MMKPQNQNKINSQQKKSVSIQVVTQLSEKLADCNVVELPADKTEFDLSKKIRDYDTLLAMDIYPDREFISVENVKEFINQAKNKSDDAGHFNHDTKVVRVADLIKLSGELGT